METDTSSFTVKLPSLLGMVKKLSRESTLEQIPLAWHPLHAEERGMTTVIISLLTSVTLPLCVMVLFL